MTRYIEEVARNFSPGESYFSSLGVRFVQSDGQQINFAGGSVTFTVMEARFVALSDAPGQDPYLQMVILMNGIIGVILVTVGWMLELKHLDQKTNVLFPQKV